MTIRHIAVTEEIAALEKQVKPMMEKLALLRRESRVLESIAFIEANKITKDEVQRSSGDGIPWHGTFTEFANWMREQRVTKRYCEWNGGIYPTAPALLGRMEATPAYIEHL